MKKLPLPKKPPTFIQPKRYCANKVCGKLLPEGHKYATCSYRCKLAVDAQLEAIEAEDKQVHEHPF